MLSDEWLPRYRLLDNFTAKWNGNGNGNGNGNAYDRGDYNSSFALRAVELIKHNIQQISSLNNQIYNKFIYQGVGTSLIIIKDILGFMYMINYRFIHI